MDIGGQSAIFASLSYDENLCPVVTFSKHACIYLHTDTIHVHPQYSKELVSKDSYFYSSLAIYFLLVCKNGFLQLIQANQT